MLLPFALASILASSSPSQDPVSAPSAVVVDDPAPLSSREYEEWVAWLTPGPEDLEWLEVGWLPTLSAGIARAREEQRPLLLWAMNGHPLGCT